MAISWKINNEKTTFPYSHLSILVFLMFLFQKKQVLLFTCKFPEVVTSFRNQVFLRLLSRKGHLLGLQIYLQWRSFHCNYNAIQKGSERKLHFLQRNAGKTDNLEKGVFALQSKSICRDRERDKRINSPPPTSPKHLQMDFHAYIKH